MLPDHDAIPASAGVASHSSPFSRCSRGAQRAFAAGGVVAAARQLRARFFDDGQQVAHAQRDGLLRHALDRGLGAVRPVARAVEAADCVTRFWIPDAASSACRPCSSAPSASPGSATSSTPSLPISSAGGIVLRSPEREGSQEIRLTTNMECVLQRTR
jgi:hypothetical protein